MVFVLFVKPHNCAFLFGLFVLYRRTIVRLYLWPPAIVQPHNYASVPNLLLLYSRIIMRLYLLPVAICTDAQLCVSTIVRLYLPTTSSYRSAKCLYAFSLMIMPLSTITPIAKAMPVSDMIFELIPKALSKIKLAAIVIGI